MNIIEIAKKENVGKRYEITIGNENIGIWELKETHRANEFEFYQKNGSSLSGCYYTSQISKMEFKEAIDWFKVSVDTPIWVKDNDGVEWFPRHFAKYENGVVYTWAFGKTSHTIGDSIGKYNEWKYAKLYQE